MNKKVKWHQDERVDEPDLSSISNYTEEEVRRLLRFLAGPDLTDVPGISTNQTPYATWLVSPDGIVYDPDTDVRITIKAGTELVLAGGTSGDILPVEADVVLAGFCPTLAIPQKLLMARVAAATVDAEEDLRVFYDEDTEGEEELTVATQSKAQIEWVWVNATVEGDIIAQMALGYQWVALMELDSATFSTNWYYVLPKTGIAASDPGMLSVGQTLWAVVKQLGRIIRGNNEPPRWLDTPAISLHTLSGWKTSIDYIIGLMGGYISTLQGQMTSLTARVLGLEKRRMIAQFYFSTGHDTNPPEYYSMKAGLDTGISEAIGTYNESGTYLFVLNEDVAALNFFAQAHYKQGLESHELVGGSVMIIASSKGVDDAMRPTITVQTGYWGSGGEWVGVNGAAFGWIEVVAWAIS